jgi:hypothetical protein
MKNEKRERLAIAAIIGTSIVLFILTIAAVVASCVIEGKLPPPNQCREGKTQIVYSCPLSLAAFMDCFAAAPGAGEIGAVCGRVETAREILDACTTGELTDSEARVLIEIFASAPARRKNAPVTL